jgi:transcriptional regulator with XRE-family HTH domain
MLNTLKSALADRGLTQRKFASLVGLSEFAFCRAIRGKRRLCASERWAIARILDIDAGTLFPRRELVRRSYGRREQIVRPRKETEKAEHRINHKIGGG